MSSPAEEPSAIVSAALSAAVSAAMAVAMSVDAKADLATMLDEWEEAQRGPTEQLVSILTKWAVICFWKAVIRASCQIVTVHVSVSKDHWGDSVSSVFSAGYLSWLNGRQESTTKQTLIRLMTGIQVVTCNFPTFVTVLFFVLFVTIK